MTDEGFEAEGSDGTLPAITDTVKVIQFKYHQILMLHETFLKTYFNGRYDVRISRDLLVQLFTFGSLIYTYSKIKRDKELMKSINFTKNFLRSRFFSDNKDIKPEILFDLIEDMTKAYHKLGISAMEGLNA